MRQNQQIPNYSEIPSPRNVIVSGIKWLVMTLAFALACSCLYLAIKVWLQVQDLPPLSSLESYDRGDPIQIFDRYDHLICSFKGAENRKRVNLDQISAAMKWAVLAAEDHTFYEHHGVSLVGTARAFLANLHAGHVVEGGSTITQQLVKNLFFEQSKRTIDRKVTEALIAWELERRYSKDQILEMYLNEAYFGSGAYGIEQAARYYFGKPAAQLRVSESAFLAGLIKSPTKLGMQDNRPKAAIQQLETIDKMVRYGFLSPARAEQVRLEPLRFWEKAEPTGVQAITKFPYFVSYVLDLVRQRYTPGEIRRHGLRIYTSLDPAVQEVAERVLKQGIANAPAGVDQGALVTVSVRDGSVLAMVGGVGDFEQSQYNCATHGHTAGSVFKSFVYLAAFDAQVMSPESEIDDKPLTVELSKKDEWKPKNFDGKFSGTITVSDALTYSRNVCAVRVAQRIGIPAVVDAARRAGIRDRLEPNLSLSLGSEAITPLEMAGAYATFARDGLMIYPWVLRRIDNRNGRIVQSFEQPASRGFGSEPISQLVSVLRRVVVEGTGQAANIANLFVAGKTGTSDQARDLWFVGFTPDLVTAVWSGNNEGSPIAGANVTGGTVMARIWRSYTVVLYADQSLVKKGLIRRTLDARTGAPKAAGAGAHARGAVQSGSGSQPSQAAADKVLVTPDGGKVILQMQQGKMDERSQEQEAGGLKFKLH
jgi:penicillin-binding protein 1A